MTNRETTIDAFRLPWYLRAVNAAGAAARRLGVPVADLDADALLRQAQRDTGLADFGARDFETPLRLMLDSLEQDAGLSAIGRVVARASTLRNLSNRLRIRAAFAADPSILDERVARPLFIVGLPRSGTTLLHRMLACVPGTRAPLTWELLLPAPPPRAETRASDPRIATIERQLALLARAVPYGQAIHVIDAREPEECHFLFENSGVNLALHTLPPVPRYTRWLLGADLRFAYREYRAQLQLLQRHTPGAPWVLKDPGHLPFLDVLLDVFPDAAIVHLHRDPVEVIGSACSLSATMQLPACERVDLHEVGRRWLDQAVESTTRAMSARARLDASRFFDVSYVDLVRDPAGLVARIAERFRYDWDAEAFAAARAYVRDHPGGKHGRHRYTLEQFGLDRETVTRRFGAYRERYAAFATTSSDVPKGNESPR